MKTDNTRFSKAVPVKNTGPNELFKVAEPVLEEYEGLFQKGLLEQVKDLCNLTTESDRKGV